MLVPAGVLVLVILASIAVDAAVAFLGQRELTNAAAAAANDAVTAALSDAAFYAGAGGAPGSLVVDRVRAEQVARRALEARSPRGVEVAAVEVTVSPSGDQVCVVVEGRVPYLFAPALPGVPAAARVRGAAAATAVAGEAGATVRPSGC